jgi:hypothetical protein
MDRRVMRATMMAALGALLAACGGGGGGAGGATSTRPPLPELSSEVVPTGERIDVSGRNFFPMSTGDVVTYSSRSDFGTSLTVRRAITAGPDPLGRYTLVEDVLEDPDIPALTSTWRLTPEGLVSVNYRSSDRLQPPAPALDEFLLYPTPFYPAGSTRTVVRQGSLGADADGDGVADSFRLEFRQVFEGFSEGERGGRLEVRARFRHRILVSIQPSRLDRETYTLSDLTEVVDLAEHSGLIGRGREETWAGGRTGRPYEDLSLLGGTVGGRNLETAWNAGSARLMRLDAVSLVYEPVSGSYFAGLSSTAANHAGSIARIDPASGATAFSEPLGGSVRSIGLSGDGTTLYAAVEGRNEVVRLSVPSLQVVSRVTLPAGIWAYSVAVSPADASTFAWFGSGDPFRAGPHLVRGNTLQPRSGNGSVTPAGSMGALAFSTDGTQLFVVGTASGIVGLHRLPVLADGFSSAVATAPDPIFGSSLQVLGEEVFAGNAVNRASDLARIAATDPSLATSCRPLPQATRWACGPGDALALPGVTVVDRARGLAPINSGHVPLPPPRPADLGQVMARIPGPSGQIALLFGGNGSPQGNWLALFDNPDFR